MTRLAEHLARSETPALTSLLGSSTIELLSKLGPDATSPAGLAYFIESIHGKRGALRAKGIRDLLLSKLEKSEAIELCQLLQLPVISPLQTLRGTDFDAVPGNLELLGRWYGVASDDFEAPLQASEGSHKAVASHKLHAHQLHAFRELRRAIAHPPSSVLVHMPFGAGKLRLAATAAIDLYRSEADDRSIVWLAPGTAMCEEAFLELQEVWRQLGSRDTTILQLYGDHPTRDLDQLGGAIAVIDILRLSQEDPALEKLGSVTSVVVIADAENVVHPVGAKIIGRMSAGGLLSVVGILAASGAAIPPGPARDALKSVFSGGCITVEADDELQSLREAGNFADIEATVEHLTSPSSPSTFTSAPLPVNDDSLDFDHIYVHELSNNVERNERLLEILKRESAGKGRIIFYATTAENARLFAGLLPVQGVKARSITAEETPAARALALQKFIAREEEKVLCVHGFLLSGISVPDMSVCVMASPCKSRATFLSTIGRLVQARAADLPNLRLIVAADSQADAGWVESLSTWSTLNI
ncbi:DEAD/DEAH box helicase [Vogesella facilis]|uniref:DEAD/DEAH box helicase n=1 Tax=Vogesella facilis TaxID=1655232 RepID=A0ABV7RE57_9NEIS